MNKYIKQSAALAALIALLMSCGKSFLDPDISEYVPQERHAELVGDKQTLPKMSKAAILKTYAIFQESWRSHDDFGLRAFQIATDVTCEDIALARRQWFVYDYALDNREANYRRTLSTWEQFYEIIAKVNLHLETYFAEESSDPGFLASKAEPLAIRGIAYFHLVNFYQHTYKGHESALGVPLSLKSTDDKLPRATVKEVYDQIVADLTFAVEHARRTPGDHTDVDKSVAAAYLSKVYAQMEDWANVAKYAAIAKTGGIDVVSTPGRSWSIDQKDILFGYDVNEQTSTLWASFWSHMDQFLPRGYAPGGGIKHIHNLLYNKIPSSDSRKKLWVNNTEFPDVAKQMLESSKNDGVELNDYAQLKFVAGDAGLEQDYCFLRVQDPILLEIEAKVELGELDAAKTLLTDFVTKRNPDFVAPNDQEALRQEVRFQRRIELWCEGTNWFDMKRWKLPIDRLGEGSNHMIKFKIETDDPRFIHKLPQREIESNPKLEQND